MAARDREPARAVAREIFASTSRDANLAEQGNDLLLARVDARELNHASIAQRRAERAGDLLGVAGDEDEGALVKDVYDHEKDTPVPTGPPVLQRLEQLRLALS